MDLASEDAAVVEAVRALEAFGVDYGSYADDPLARASSSTDSSNVSGGGGGGGVGQKKVNKRARKDQSTHAAAMAILHALGKEGTEFEPNRRGAFLVSH